MWQIAGEQVSWHQHDFSATVKVLAPESGLVDVYVHGRSVEDCLRPLQLTVQGEPAGPSVALLERYVRGLDLIATYAESSAEDRRRQIYWRMSTPDDTRLLANLEILVSLQTSRLEEVSTVRLTTELGAGELWRLLPGRDESQVASTEVDQRVPVTFDQPGVMLFRPRNMTWSYAEMVFPMEVGLTAVGPRCDSPEWSRLETSLITEQLEKGVIRRARLRAVWLPRDDDRQLTLNAYHRFLAAPLPLTV